MLYCLSSSFLQQQAVVLQFVWAQTKINTGTDKYLSRA